jgi:transcriptional regulator with XRE-family HTH domain
VDGIRFGQGIRAIRQRNNWRQRDLAAAARCSQALVSRIERGRGDRVTPHVLERVARALDARLVVRLDWRGERLDRLLDERHAALVEGVVAVLRQEGWELIPEASFSIFGERGSVDILAWHAVTRSLLVVEVKSALADVQDTLMKVDRKVRLATRIAPADWRSRTISSLLVVEDTRTGRRRVDAHRAIFASRFPDRAIAIRRFLSAPADMTLHGLWFLSTSTQATARRRVSRP